MFNKKRIFILVIFLLCLFFLMTFAGGSRDEGIVTRLVEFYDGFDDSLVSSAKVEVGKDAEVPEDPEHENYVFSGWYLYEDHDVKVTKFTDIRENLKVIALYADDLNNNGIADEEEDKLTVTFFDTLGNRVLKEEEVLPGLDASAPEAPTYDGYEFGGWSRGYTNVTEDITVNTIYNNIVAPTINISADNLSSMLVYEDVPTFTATATDRNGNPVEVVVTTNIDGNTAGSYTVTYTATDNDGNTTTITRDFVVERRNLEVTIDDKTSVYGKDFEELTYEITDGVIVEEFLPGITLNKANGTNVGVYAITGTYTNRNYNITFINGIYNITKANYDINIGINDKELTYNGKVQNVINKEGNLPEDVTMTVTYIKDGQKVENVKEAGDYNVEITFNCTDNNYNCPSNINGNVKVNKAEINIIADNKSSEKGEELVNLTYEIDGVIYEKDDLNINISTDANKDVSGIYDIIVTASNSNYNISITNAKYKVFNDENNNGIDDDEENHYTITYVDYDDSVIKVFENILVDTLTPSVNNPTREGYVFTGWNPEVSTTVVSDAKYMATYKVDSDNDGTPDENQRRVIYKDYDGKELYNSLITVGEKTPIIKNPTREYYTFIGWTPEVSETVIDNVTYTATYKINNDENGNGNPDELDKKYTIIYEDYDGKVINTFENVLEGLKTPTIENPTREYYTFTGWTPEISKTVIGDAVYTATYKITNDENENGNPDELDKKYTITYKNDDGTIISTFENVLEGLTTPTIENPIKEGYKFNGWTPEVSKTVIGDAEYTATFIDALAPVISPKVTLYNEDQYANITSTITDVSGIKVVKYLKGEHNAEEVLANGTEISSDNSEYVINEISENGYYTIYAEDNNGNASIEVVLVEGIIVLEGDFEDRYVTGSFGKLTGFPLFGTYRRPLSINTKNSVKIIDARIYSQSGIWNRYATIEEFENDPNFGKTISHDENSLNYTIEGSFLDRVTIYVKYEYQEEVAPGVFETRYASKLYRTRLSYIWGE